MTASWAALYSLLRPRKYPRAAFSSFLWRRCRVTPRLIRAIALFSAQSSDEVRLSGSAGAWEPGNARGESGGMVDAGTPTRRCTGPSGLHPVGHHLLDQPGHARRDG